MTRDDSLLRRYYRDILKWLPCSRKQKKQIMEQIQNDVQEYFDRHPNSDFAQMKATFGDPQTIAAAYVENTDTMELLRSLRIRRKIVTIVTVVVAIVLIAWAGTVTWAVVREVHGTNGHYEMTID